MKLSQETTGAMMAAILFFCIITFVYAMGIIMPFLQSLGL